MEKYPEWERVWERREQGGKVAADLAAPLDRRLIHIDRACAPDRIFACCGEANPGRRIED